MKENTQKTAPNPRFKHDCEACTFLGSFGEHDLYHCPQHGLPTLIARRSSDGSDYSSFLAEIVRNAKSSLDGYEPGRALLEAYRRAFVRRLPLG